METLKDDQNWMTYLQLTMMPALEKETNNKIKKGIDSEPSLLNDYNSSIQNIKSISSREE